MFKGCTFDNQNVTSKNDGGLYGAIFTGDGILWGCSMSVTTDTLTIQPGEMVIGGRLIWIDGATQIPFPAPITNGFGQVILTIDLSKTATPSDFDQVEASVVYSTTTTFPDLTQGEINSENGDMVYQQELAVVSIAGSNITEITRQIGSAKINAALFNGKDASYYLPVISENEATLKNLNLTGGIITGAGNVLIVLRSDNGVGIANTAGTGYAPLRCGNLNAGNIISMATETYRFMNNGGNALDILANVLYGVRFLGDNGIRVMNAAANAFTTVYAANTTGSSRRYKENIREMTYEEAERIMQAVSVAFEWKKDSGWQGESYSFIAEELEEIDERFVYRNGKGEVEGILVNPIIAAQNMILKRHEEKIRKFDALAAKLVEKGVFTQEEIENL